ncbi:hypothetical protein ACP70R_021999 [Stipagrostis hirtigluma subsp. patula]
MVLCYNHNRLRPDLAPGRNQLHVGDLATTPSKADSRSCWWSSRRQHPRLADKVQSAPPTGPRPPPRWRLRDNALEGSEEKLAACKGLGADVCINYKTEDFVERVKQETNGKDITYT